MKVYGWIATSINFSTSEHNNFPVSYDIFPDKIELNQAVVYVERLPDTVQTDHFDWGFHLTAFEGIDYRFTTAKGYFRQQLLASNKQHGFDPVLGYLDLYFPVKDGLDIRIGRFLSVPGIEAQLAPNNYNMTHSLLYTIDPFTDSGKGQRTGFATKYTENKLYATKYIGSTVMLRPELRFDHSWDLAAYNNGKARNQLFFGLDLIYKF